MNYGLMHYNYPEEFQTVNIGDYVQSLAASQYLPDDSQPVLVDREKLSSYMGDPVKMIMNGWYMHDTTYWPPSDQIDPLFVAFHISRDVENEMLSVKGVDYLKKHTPIGCRNEDTLQMLQRRGIDAYYSSCLTLTLDKKYAAQGERSDEILFVDPCLDSRSRLYRKLEDRNWIKNKKKPIIESMALDSKTKPELFYQTYEKIFPKNVLESSSYIRHQIPIAYFKEEESRFRYAENLLARYSKARLVITSRIHCALPCLALGTPVIYIHDVHASKRESARVEKLLNLFHVVNISENSFKSSEINLKTLKHDFNHFKLENKTNYKKYAENLKMVCEKFIQQ